MPAPSAERQHPEAWPASTDGHLRGVSLKIDPANKLLFAGTVPANKNNKTVFLVIHFFKINLYIKPDKFKFGVKGHGALH